MPGLLQAGLRRRAERALERQLAYQTRKASELKGREVEVMAAMAAQSAMVRAELDALQPLPDTARVLEVGCGATGLVFFFDGGLKVGVDPLSDHYARLFPAWQGRAATAAAAGERLPFAEAAFDIVLCDNVVDHAENPREIVRELVRVLAPGGILYFTVHVHHRLYDAASRLHALWRALGLPLEVGPFADHTVHLSPAGARTLFAGLPIRILKEDDNVEKRRARSRWLPWKNGTYRLIATR